MVSLNLPPAPLRKGNIQAVDLHHSIGLSATRLLYDRAANYGSIIVWKYLKLHIQFSRFVGSGFRSLSGPVRFRDIIVSYFRRKVYGLVVQVTHPLSPCIVYNAFENAKKSRLKAKPSLCPQTGCLSMRLLKRNVFSSLKYQTNIAGISKIRFTRPAISLIIAPQS